MGHSPAIHPLYAEPESRKVNGHICMMISDNGNTGTLCEGGGDQTRDVPTAVLTSVGQMDIPSYHVGPPHRKETSGQTSAEMGRLLQRTGRSTMVQRGKRQKKVETTRETFVHRQEVVKGSERTIVKEIKVPRLKYHV
ncbi:hypothetical protein ANN_22181 [Periplaneta americana]|uniref:Uncharacterized protein n=1 Tax=Periplaneta americana TaxID=6978 RepID=A0ABQ8S7R9_PERAM|nr:hypothetical protein ANN_22181 [Periplaneta americana]